MIAPLLLILLVLFGMLLPGFGFTAKAATPPSLKIESGTTYRYSVSRDNPKSIKYGTATSTASKMTISQSGNTFTIAETENNKLYELGYVPIVTSLNVPAETTLYVTLTFTLSGKKNGSGSAQETIELFDFGTSDASSSLTFQTKANSSGSYTKASDRNEDNGMSANYTVTVAYRNTATKSKAIYHYFGFFAGVHYGSTKTHKLNATCTIKSGTVTTNSNVASKINFDQSNARTTVVGASKLQSATYPKDNFFPDTNWDSLTTDQQSSIKSISNNTCTTNEKWRYNRLSVQQPTGTETKLQIFSNETPLVTGLGRAAYTPFTVPITVPAYTRRVYYLTFEITYDRNAGRSGAGFFAELIADEVPSAFNTNNSANTTGKTQLRVYSTGGNTHSGTVVVRVELNNTTAAAKTYEQSYVFFAGHRSVGLYTPTPEFQLELKNVGYNQYEDTYNVTKDAQNCTISVASSVSAFTQLTATVTPKEGYSRPSTVTVKVDGKTLASSKYTYNKSTGAITIPMDYVRGAIRISAQGVANQYTVTFDANGGTVDTKPMTVTYGSTYGTLPTAIRPGYTFFGWYTATTDGTLVESTTRVSRAASHTLYARWGLNHSNHKVCYAQDNTTCVGCQHKAITTWKGWNGTGAISYDESGVAYIAMTEDVTANLSVAQGKTLYLCLNGRVLTGSITVNGTLELCNCKGRGEVSPPGGSAITVNSTGTLNYYNGLLKGGTGDNVPLYVNKNGIVNLYRAPRISASATCDYEIRGNSPGFLRIATKLDAPHGGKPIRVNFGTDSSVSLSTYTQVTITTGWSDYMSSATPTKYFVPRTNRNAKVELDSTSGELVLRRLRVTLSDGSNTYYLKYNGGTFNSGTLPTPTRTGYTFDGWYTAETGGTKVTTSTAFTDDTTLYPRFVANTYTVSFNINYTGGTNPASQKVTYDSTYGDLPTPTRTGYTFLGWYTAATGGTKVESTTPVNRTASHSLYAHWEVVEIVSIDITWGAMEFTYQDGDWDPETHEFKYGKWIPNKTDGNMITVENTGTIPVSVSFTYKQTIAAVSAEFYDGTTSVAAPVALPTGDKKQVRLKLIGKPSGTLKKSKLGTVTVKIGGKQS